MEIGRGDGGIHGVPDATEKRGVKTSLALKSWSVCGVGGRGKGKERGGCVGRACCHVMSCNSEGHAMVALLTLVHRYADNSTGRPT
jgi:hypothetical protein